MKLKDLCLAADLRCPSGEEEREIQSIATDSRDVVADGLFICIRGLHTDGHAYIEDAIRAGAACIVADSQFDLSQVGKGPVLLQAENTRRAAAQLYHAWYGYPSKRLKIIGVTGTNGKTSVTHMLKAIFEAALCRCGLIGTVGCETAGRRLDSTPHHAALANMTTPDPEELYRILREMVDDGVEYVLMEVTSHALALHKLDPIAFEAAIFTNLTPEHLDFHGTMEAYANAKAALFAQSRLAILNLDSPYADSMRAACKGRVLTCSVKGSADYTAELLSEGEAGVGYRLSSGRSTLRIVCPIPGHFSVVNSMQAAACALELGIGASAVKVGLSSLAGIRGRMERVKLGLDADFTVLIDYAHTPDALENLLRTVRQLKKPDQRVVLLFGCGGDRDKSKRATMGAIASVYADEIYLTSDNSRNEDPQAILDDVLLGIDPQKVCHVIPDRREAITRAVQQAKKGDLLLLAGKGHEEYEITREGRKPFREKEIVREAFALRRSTKHNIESTETEL